MASPCCFGVIETSWVDSSGQVLPARAVQRNTVMVERSSIPRAFISPPPPAPAPEFEYINQLSIYPVYPSTPEIPTDRDNQATADCIAEILAPLNMEHNRELMRHYRKAERREEESRARQAEIAALTQQNLEEEAVRRVRERNRQDDLKAMEDNARLRIEYDFRSSTSSVRSSSAGDYSSRDRLVIVNQSREAADALRDHRCSNCHEFGHRSRDCMTTVTFSVPERRRSRRQSVTYVKADPPRRQVRYVQGA